MVVTITGRYVKCDLCGADASTTVFPADQKCGPIVRCRHCGLVYANPQMVVKYESVRCHTGHIAQALGKRRAFEYRARLLTKYHSPGKLLEVGAHHGLFLDAARKYGGEVLGIEPDPQCCQWAKDNLGVTILPGYFETVELEPSSFDAVVFLNVLEHVQSPTQALRRAFELLKPGGVVFVEVPNIHTLFVKIFGKQWFHFEPGHYYYFSKRTLRVLFGKTGFKVLKMGYLPKYVTPVLVVNVFAKHMPWLNGCREAIQGIMQKLRLDRVYLRLQTKDFLGAIGRKDQA